MIRKGGDSKATTWKSLVAVVKDYIQLLYDVYIVRIENNISKDSISHLKKTNFERKLND